MRLQPGEDAPAKAPRPPTRARRLSTSEEFPIASRIEWVSGGRVDIAGGDLVAGRDKVARERRYYRDFGVEPGNTDGDCEVGRRTGSFAIPAANRRSPSCRMRTGSRATAGPSSRASSPPRSAGPGQPGAQAGTSPSRRSGRSPEGRSTTGSATTTSASSTPPAATCWHGGRLRAPLAPARRRDRGRHGRPPRRRPLDRAGGEPRLVLATGVHAPVAAGLEDRGDLERPPGRPVRLPRPRRRDPAAAHPPLADLRPRPRRHLGGHHRLPPPQRRPAGLRLRRHPRPEPRRPRPRRRRDLARRPRLGAGRADPLVPPGRRAPLPQGRGRRAPSTSSTTCSSPPTAPGSPSSTAGGPPPTATASSRG